MSEALNNLIGFFQRGGLFMWPLLICSIVALTTIILRGFALREKHIMPLVIESEIERLMPGGSPDRLMRIVENDSSSLGRIGSCFFASGIELRRLRHASNCSRHCRSLECDCLRALHCGAHSSRL